MLAFPEPPQFNLRCFLGLEYDNRGLGHMRILWVTRNCLLDHSSGASLSAKEMLTSLLRRGANITVVSATTFDSEAARGIFFENTSLEPLSDQVMKIVDEGIINFIVKTINYDPNAIQLIELHTFLDVYKKALSKYQPDIVWMKAYPLCSGGT